MKVIDVCPECGADLHIDSEKSKASLFRHGEASDPIYVYYVCMKGHKIEVECEPVSMGVYKDKK